MISLKKILGSVRNALKGFRYAWRENSFRALIFASLIAIFLVIILPVTVKEAVILILAIMLVLVLELVNTIFEHLVDLVNPRLHHQVAIVKDMMAAAVILAATGALVVGLLIFWPYIF
jgi:diacylglycerol kinase